MVGTVVQVLIAEQSSPALLTVTLPGFLARAVLTSWILDTLGTETALPPHSAFAFVGFVTESLTFGTAGETDRFGAILTRPAIEADFLPSLVTAVMAKVVVTWCTEGRTSGTVVVLITHYTILVLQLGPVRLMDKVAPFWSLL